MYLDIHKSCTVLRSKAYNKEGKTTRETRQLVYRRNQIIKYRSNEELKQTANERHRMDRKIVNRPKVKKTRE